MIRTRATRPRLDPVSYQTLRQKILRRDDWRCQSCGTMSSLEVHHRQSRSRSGADSEENLITLCAACHASAWLRPQTKVATWRYHAERVRRQEGNQLY
jgi:5-methylcytosine-specific restriction endonuclease McrA